MVKNQRGLTYTLLFWDILTTFLAFAFGRYLIPDGKPLLVFSDLFIYFILLFRIFWIYLFSGYDVFSYDLKMPISFRTFFSEIFLALAILLFFMLTPIRYKGADYGRKAIFSALSLQVFLSFLLRSAFYYLFVEKKRGVQKLYLILRKELSLAIKKDLQLLKKDKLFDIEILSPSKMPENLNQNAIVVFNQFQDLPKKWQNFLFERKLHGKNIFDLVSFYENFLKALPVLHLSHGWFLYNEGFNILGNPIYWRMKRFMDVFLATIFFILFSPILLLTFLLLRISEGSPVIFTQKRHGLKAKPFTLYKFRTMKKDAEKHGPQWAKAKDSRIHPLGKILRLLRIDELPQLYNVLKGDMSFIGPRPERPEFDEILEKKIPFYKLRYLVRPGITGWAQVNYPYGASEEDAQKKLEYDLYYIKNFSFSLDFRILLETIRTVIFARGR